MYGDGIVTADVEPTDSPLETVDVVVENSEGAAMPFVGSAGSVSGCVIRDSVFAIVLEQGADPVIGDDNMFLNNESNEVTRGAGLEPSPPPEPLVPP